MDGANLNGGNAEVSREDSNLESGDGGVTAVTVPMEDTLSNKTTAGNADTQEVNGDLKSSPKKHGPPFPRRRMKKLKANSIESDATEPLGTRGRKRKFSELEDGSSEDSEFNGFDSKGVELQPGSHVLKKLIGNILYYVIRNYLKERNNYVSFFLLKIFFFLLFFYRIIFHENYWKNSHINFLLRFIRIFLCLYLISLLLYLTYF